MREMFFVPGAFYVLAPRVDVEPDDEDEVPIVASVHDLALIRHAGDRLVLLFSDRYLAEDYLESMEDLDRVVAKFRGYEEMVDRLTELSDAHALAVIDKAPRGSYGMVIQMDTLIETIRQQLT